MSQQIQISGGAKVRDLQDVIIGTSGVLSSLAFNVANGVPKLDVNGKILVSQLPNSVMEYKGVWNAATNSPTLTNGGAFNQGDVYLCDTAGTVNFGAGPIAFVVGDQVIYSGSIWQRASGATGTVTSVALTESGDSLNITGSPITTSGTINIGFNGTNLQYVNGAGNLTTFPTLMTSVGLTMPSAFTVTNSPLTGAGGTLAVTGAGVASQYIRGDGTLADFPSSGGGGSSVSYYLNGGTSQGTIGGVTYYEMSKTADTGTGVDFTKTGDGLIVSFLTDAGDPAQLNIPAGNWNYEIYASMSANGGTPQLYAELYVYNGTTFTLISTSSNEILYDGVNLNLYTFAMTVPATTLALTDRLAVKLYATNSGGKTTTIHTQDSHLCQIITTFSTGITALNGLTAQVQYFQVGTSGTDFNISSTTATHTFNIPDASATARGLITIGTQTIAGTKTFSDATKNNGGIFLQNASSSSLAGYMNIGGLTNGVKFTSGGGISNTFTLPSATGYTFTFPNATGTIALTSDISYPVTSVFGRTGAVVATSGDYTTAQVTESGNLYFTDSRARLALSFVAGSGAYNSTTGVITIPTNNNQITNGANYITLTSLSAGTGISYNNTTGVITNSAPDQTVALTASTGISVTGTYPNFTITNTSPSSGGTVTSVAALTIGTSGTDLSSTVANSTTTPVITLNVPTASATNRGALSSADWTTFNNKQSALTNPVTGTGTTNYLPKFTSASTIGNSQIFDNGTSVSIGSTALSQKFIVVGGNGNQMALDNTGQRFTQLNFNNNGTQKAYLATDNTNNLFEIYGSAGYSLSFGTDGGQKMLLNASGNLGLGVTPSAWSSPFNALQLGTYGQYIAGQTNAADMKIGTNHYYGSGDYRYFNSISKVSRYDIGADGFIWNVAPIGTANASITFTQAMTFNASGNLSIGNTNNAYRLDVTGNTNDFISRFTGGTSSNINIGIYATSSPGGGSIGTISNHQFAIFTNSTDRLTIASTGAATFSSSVSATNALLNTTETTGAKLDVASSLSKSSTTFARIASFRTNEALASYPLELSIAQRGATQNIELQAGHYGLDFSANIVLQRDGGLVLIGSSTVSGSSILQVTGAATFSSSVTAAGGNSPTLGFQLTTTTGSSTPRITSDNANATVIRTGASGSPVVINNFANSAELVRFTDGGNVGIGDSGSSNVRLQIKTGGNTSASYAIIVRNSSNSDLFFVKDDAATQFFSSVTATSFFESSDSRLKTLIQDNYQTKGIASITPKLYTKNGKVELGYYAQDFVGVLDSAVSKGSDDMLSLSYREVHTAKIYALEQEIKELKAKMN